MTTGPESRGELVSLDVAQGYIGSTEKNCVLQLLAVPGETVTGQDLNRRFADVQEPSGYVTYKSRTNLQRAIIGSHDRGAHTYQSTDDTSLTSWATTKSPNSDVPDALVGHNLALSADYGLSLERFWSRMAQNDMAELSGPQARLRLFEALTTMQPGQAETISIPELMQRTGLSRGRIHEHIRCLYEFGFVEYDATEFKDQTGAFEIIGSPDPEHTTLSVRHENQIRQMPNYRGELSIRRQILQRLAEFNASGKTVFSYDELLSGGADKTEPGIVLAETYRSTLIGILLTEGVLQRRHKVGLGMDRFSSISLTPEQREIMTRAVRFHHGLRGSDPNSIDEGLRYGSDIMENSALVAQLPQKGYDAAPTTRAKSYGERAATIGAILLDAEGELSTGIIQGLVDEGEVTPRAIGKILRTMRANGLVSARKQGNQIFWRRDLGE